MSEQKVTYITDDKSLKDILVMAIEQEGGISPNHILCVAHKYLVENCGTPEANIQSVDEVEVDGDAMPREIRIKWTRVKRPSAVTPTAAEATEWEREQCQQILSSILETVRASAKYSKMAGILGITLTDAMSPTDSALYEQMRSRGKLTLKDFEPLRLADITPGELAALREALEDKGRRLDTAESAVTSLQIQLSEAHRRHAEDNTEHDREMTKLRATIKSMQDDARYTKKSESLRSAWEALAAIDLTTARMVVLSGLQLYPDLAGPALEVPHYRLNVDLVSSLPGPIRNYIHAMCDNLLLSPPPKPVTQQMVKDMINRIHASMSASTFSDLTRKYSGAHPLSMMAADKYEAFYIEAEDLLNGETF
ncbi:hypothetical protein LD421_004355 [Salmonella enterica]|uniref:Uncharacterized protein n=2 Tax=Chivirus FSLSP030 TaxID=1173754 RepID=S4TNC1_9CAUD|nr:hypothetical protein N276_gp53 [Salmonella phage FSL SP-030]AGF87966.1 hypothetical protein SP039_00265 [Salmonella phage FSL SP-039]EIF1915789.1 hypothetical protein [Salmonella enterica]MCO9522965.1 hypothetical protein [Salmonella enterica subsp. enterica serovar Mbandaka]HBL5798889.1 hypothetical protein [Salmonella enterica subsp. enterica serovar Typhimurium]AGF88313.1 hypothetical protein SP030_00265 [Salmonella phage FSL SP-030]